MESRKIFSKLNIKDYNNELEKILDNKLFSLDVKNILLSMLYKIETTYKDYEKVKVEVLTKKDFIPYVLQIIKEKCYEIEFIKTDVEQDYNQKEIVDVEKGKILCYPNEKSLLSAIWYMGEKDIEYEPTYAYVKEAIQEAMKIGNNMNQVEVIRDFNGWSWDISVNEIENISYNIVYQSLVFLYGIGIDYMNMDVVVEDEMEESIFELQDSKDEEEILMAFYEVIMKEYLRTRQEETEKLIKMKQEKDEGYQLIQNKELFVKSITDRKKEAVAQIENIDRIVNNTTLLREEYAKRNEKLPNKQKIFSISHLADRLDKERKSILEEIKEFNRVLEPKEFIKEKEKRRKEALFLKHLDLEKPNKIKNLIVKFCKLVLKKAEREIELLEDRDDIVDWIYRLRYYCFLPIDDKKKLNDMEELNSSFESIIKLIIKKAQQNKIWENFSEDQELTYQVLKEIFNSKMIDLEKANIACRYEDGTLYLQYYDANMLEKETKLEVSHIKIKRKFKLFV